MMRQTNASWHILVETDRVGFLRYLRYLRSSALKCRRENQRPSHTFRFFQSISMFKNS
jgi:hypothetical protein